MQFYLKKVQERMVNLPYVLPFGRYITSSFFICLVVSKQIYLISRRPSLKSWEGGKKVYFIITLKNVFK